MKKAWPLLLALLGILCLIGGIVCIFNAAIRTHAIVAIIWGLILLSIAKTGIPEDKGIFSRFRSQENPHDHAVDND